MARHALVSYAFATIVLAALLAAPHDVHAKRTACTITINSADEREVLRRQLPADEWDVVELVERGRPDWLAAACRRRVACDVLVISGHFDGGVEFYSDRLDQRESLPVDDLEREACSASCPALFAQLREVYLFGCNTLNAEVTTSLAGEVERALVAAGGSPDEAARTAAALNARHPRSNRDRMRALFRGVPLLYGFASKAPLGHVAGPVLEQHLQGGGWRDVGSGRVNGDLVRRFAAVSMTTAAGGSDGDAHAGWRDDACRLVDARTTQARKTAFVHDLLRRDAASMRAAVDGIEKFLATLDGPARSRPDVAQALAAIRDDAPARERVLGYARRTDEAATRARMIELARDLGWLSPDQRAAELLALLGERMAWQPAPADVDLACRLGRDGSLAAGGLRAPPAPRSAVQQAMLACLGDAQARLAAIDALSAGDGDAEAVQVLLHHRPLTDADEFRRIVRRLDRIASQETLARTLEVLARTPLADDETYAQLARLFPVAKSLAVQRAIAGVLVRADYGGERAALARMLRQHRVRAGERDVIDVLIRRLAM